MINQNAPLYCEQIFIEIASEINLAYGKLCFGIDIVNFSLNTIKKWKVKIETILPFVNVDEFCKNLAPKFQAIIENLNKLDKQGNPNTNSALLPLMPEQNQDTEVINFEPNKFKLWYESLKTKLSYSKADEALNTSLEKNDFRNLIAIACIYMSVPPELQTPIRNINVAYDMIQTLQNKYNTPSTSEHVAKKRKLK